MNLADLNSLLPLAIACIAGMGWLFRLEAKAGSKADSTALQLLQAEVASHKVEIASLKARADAQDAAIKAAMDGHNNTTIEVVRLQEQIKHLTDVIERQLARYEQEQKQPAGRRRTRPET